MAVSYCLLRGGRLPFPGAPPEVMMGHFREAPDLAMLPGAERPAVARALAKRPAERWPDCRTFVDAVAGSHAVPGRPGLDSSRPLGPRPAARRPVLWPIGLLASAALAALLTTVATSGRSREPGPARLSDVRADREPPREVLGTAGPRPAAVPAEVAPPAGDAAGDLLAMLDPRIFRTDGRGESSGGPGRESEPADAEGARPAEAPDLAPAEQAPPSPSREPIPLPEADRNGVNDPTPPKPKPAASTAEPDGPRPTAGRRIEARIPPPGPAASEGERPAGGEAASAVNPDRAGHRAEGAVTARPPGVRPAIEGHPEVGAGHLPGAKRPAMVASITVLLPSAKAELVVKGEVGKGNPDEWYGPTRVIHSPPLDRGADYIVGGFWLDEAGRQQTRTCRIRVEPGKVYEANLRSDVPTSREIPKADLSGDFTPGRS